MPKHNSVPMSEVEFISLNPTEISPLISKCVIKVCYVGEEPNRNKSIITKEVARQMAPSLRGAAIVGFYNEDNGDFEQHNRYVDIIDDKVVLKESGKPYGFVPTDAKIWFQSYIDDGEDVREYLVTEGYLWTGQYPECKRVISVGNNQSMELDPKRTKQTEIKDGPNKFFLINEAIISKLCILGEEFEPCFEGAQIEKATNFSLDESLKNDLYNLMEQMKTLIEGGNKPMELKDNEEVVVEEVSSTEEVVVEENSENLDENGQNEASENQISTEGEKTVCPVCGQEECICEQGPKYNLEEVTEYVQLKADYEDLQNKYSLIETELNDLRTFKKEVDKKEKQSLIDSFYMLSEEDKADVVSNIDNYSLEDIKAKLCIICVENKVNFDKEEDNKEEETTVYNLFEGDSSESIPNWVKAIKNVKKDLK